MLKVGDRVSSIMEFEPANGREGSQCSDWKVGEIIEIDESELPYKVRFEDGFVRWYKRHWIEAVEIEHYDVRVEECDDETSETPSDQMPSQLLTLDTVEHQVSACRPTQGPPSNTFALGTKQQKSKLPGSWLAATKRTVFSSFWPVRPTQTIEHATRNGHGGGTRTPTLESVWLGLFTLDSFMEKLGWVVRPPTRPSSG